MKQSSTFFLKTAVIIIGLAALALCGYLLPMAMSKEVVGGYQPILFGMFISVIPFFVALYQALKLLSYIDNHKAFSDLSVQALANIKYAVIIISAMYVVGMPYIYIVAERDDAPGVILIGLVIIGASAVIATFAGVLQKLLKNAIDIKSENDLTV